MKELVPEQEGAGKLGSAVNYGKSGFRKMMWEIESTPISLGQAKELIVLIKLNEACIDEDLRSDKAGDDIGHKYSPFIYRDFLLNRNINIAIMLDALF